MTSLALDTREKAEGREITKMGRLIAGSSRHNRVYLDVSRLDESIGMLLAMFMKQT